MQERATFWARAAASGWMRVVGLSDHLTFAASLVLLALGAFGVSIKFGPEWLAPSLLAALLAAMVLDGAYIEWRDKPVTDTEPPGGGFAAEDAAIKQLRERIVRVRDHDFQGKPTSESRDCADLFAWEMADSLAEGVLWTAARYHGTWHGLSDAPFRAFLQECTLAGCVDTRIVRDPTDGDLSEACITDFGIRVVQRIRALQQAEWDAEDAAE